jgi:hypothetical protein
MGKNVPDPNPSFDATLSSAPAESGSEIASLAEQFEQAWRSGQRPHIEDYLNQVPADEQHVLLRELLSRELSGRQQAGESFTIDHYLARFPEHRETVAEFFSQIAKEPGTDSTVDRDLVGDQSTQTYLAGQEATTSPSAGSARYRKVRKLGEGAFGTVWLVEDLELKRQVALKEPRPDRLQNAADIETYLAEARVLASLDHPHIVPVYDVGRTAEGSCYVVSKLIDGTDLAEYVKHSPITFAQAASVVAQIADALQHTRAVDLVSPLIPK